MQTRSKGLTATEGLGYIKEEDIYIERVFDEHAIINNKEFRDRIGIGDKVKIIPNHICPVTNLYDKAYLISQGQVIKTLEISSRGRLD